jgi:hypothetical protein
MKLLILLSFLTLSASNAAAQETMTKKIVTTARPVDIHDGSYGKRVMVLFGNQRTYAETVESVLDTLGKNYSWKLFSDPDSIKRYSNSKSITNILLITGKQKR